MSAPFWRVFAALVVAFAATLGVAWCTSACTKTPLPVRAEVEYGAELQACVAQAKFQDSGLAGSKACEAAVDARWHITTKDKDGAP